MKTETKETTLQRIMEQKTRQICSAIERAIKNGAKIIKRKSALEWMWICYIDGILTQFNLANSTVSVVLNFESEKIAEIFDCDLDELREKAEQKRAELQAIEEQIKEKEKSYETDNN